jgi:pilus assembly protein CpaE
MKIAVISPNKTHLHEMGAVLESHSHAVVLVEGGKSKMRAVAEQEHPDLMVIDGMCCDPSELALVEYVTTHHASIAIVLLCATNTPEFLINSMRAGVREVLPSPATPVALLAAVGRIAAKLPGTQSRNPGKVLAFIPCKGGCGATFLATNLGYQLAETNSVLLIDLNLQFGDALSFVHDGMPSSTIADVAHDITRLDASFLAACAVTISEGFSVLAAPEDPSQAMEIKPEHIDAILDLAVKQYDFVLLDVCRNLDTLAIKALDRAYRIYPILQAGLPHLRNASKWLAVFKSLGYPIEKIEPILNRFEKGGEIGVDDVKRTLGLPTVHTIPNSHKEVDVSINHGEPLVGGTRANSVARALAEFAKSLSPKHEGTRSLLGRLFKRA